MYRILHNARIPKWLKALSYVLLTITLVYLIGIMFYKILECMRIVIHFLSDKRNWWTFVVCILILIIGSLLIAQYGLGLDPFGKFMDYVINKWNEYRNWLSCLIGGA